MPNFQKLRRHFARIPKQKLRARTKEAKYTILSLPCFCTQIPTWEYVQHKKGEIEGENRKKQHLCFGLYLSTLQL